METKAPAAAYFLKGEIRNGKGGCSKEQTEKTV